MAIVQMANANGARVDLVLVILPKSAAHIRAKVKLWGDVHHGIMTQCVVCSFHSTCFELELINSQREDKLWDSDHNQFKAKDQYCNNVAIKFVCLF